MADRPISASRPAEMEDSTGGILYITEADPCRLPGILKGHTVPAAMTGAVHWTAGSCSINYVLMHSTVPVVCMASVRNGFEAGKIHYEGHRKGWALEIQTFLGPEMATSEASAIWALRYINLHHTRVLYTCRSPGLGHPPTLQSYTRVGSVSCRIKLTAAPFFVSNLQINISLLDSN
jgi:hypothetical protein